MDELMQNICGHSGEYADEERQDAGHLPLCQVVVFPLEDLIESHFLLTLEYLYLIIYVCCLVFICVSPEETCRHYFVDLFSDDGHFSLWPQFDDGTGLVGLMFLAA